jgi:hypothetical protein
VVDNDYRPTEYLDVQITSLLKSLPPCPICYLSDRLIHAFDASAVVSHPLTSREFGYMHEVAEEAEWQMGSDSLHTLKEKKAFSPSYQALYREWEPFRFSLA